MLEKLLVQETGLAAAATRLVLLAPQKQALCRTEEQARIVTVLANNSKPYSPSIDAAADPRTSHSLSYAGEAEQVAPIKRRPLAASGINGIEWHQAASGENWQGAQYTDGPNLWVSPVCLCSLAPRVVFWSADNFAFPNNAICAA
eukprot:1150935-Pelagomonas_calceolata.AAC.18